MKTSEKTDRAGSSLIKCISMSFFLVIISVWAAACDKDPDLPVEEPKQQEDPDGQQDEEGDEPRDTVTDPQGDLDPDLVAEYLVLKNAVKIPGDLPSATDGQVKIEIQDTIFVVRGYPLGHRIQFKHDPATNPSGFHIYVGGSSFYYDVPENLEEDQYLPPSESDSTSVLVLDLDLEEEDVDYPYSVDLVIQPHDESGLPLDAFDRIITIEDPNDSGSGSCNSITQPVSNNQIHWEWDFTVYELNGDVLYVFAPGLAQVINSEAQGCCNTATNVSYTVNTSPTCNALIGSSNTTSGSMQKVTLELDDYSVRPYELWQIYDDGSLTVFGNEIKKQFDISTTNFCSEIAGYTFNNEDSGGTGTHDFVPGAGSISFNFPIWDGGWRPTGGSLIYTCHTMIITRGGDGNLSSVYRRLIYDPYLSHNPIEFYTQWKPWFD